MIAPAMNSRTDGALTYQSLGQRKASVERSIPAEKMTRLRQECRELGDLQVKLSFDRDARYRVVVEGVIEATAKLPCHLCEEAVLHSLRTKFSATIATTEEQADYWSSGEENSDLNIVVIEAPRLDIVELVEDEILLDLPSQVCIDLNCVNRPTMVYDQSAGADGGAQRQGDTGFGGGIETLVQEDELSKVEHTVERQMPFVGLKAAMQELDALQGSDDEEV